MVSSTRIDDADFSAWLETLSAHYPPAQIETLHKAFEFASGEYGNQLLPSGEGKLAHAVETAFIVAGMHLDYETIAAALLVYCKADSIVERFGASIAALAGEVERFGLIETIGAAKEGQLEGLRKMLLAMVQDLRVVLLKLSDQLQTLRFLAASEDRDSQRRAAEETRDIYAPLANRLGIWQIKWELEDLAFRFIEPDTYKRIARLLDERRVDRERFISQAKDELRRELDAAGIVAEITGRPKHIYSIYKKMQRKQLGFDELFDVRALRILVDDVQDCYAALGVVHNLWNPIAREFDDYIAKPKDNGYRSLHTGVIGPEGKTLEVQIRTRQMHQDSEMGVASHWRYKEGTRRDVRFEEKIAALRRVLEWEEDLADSGELAGFRTELFQDTIYVLTPQAKVIDLPKGATPVDFAYRVHTDLGHRCRGAKVDGAIVPLNYRLRTGQRVEITAAKQGGPSRDWLNPEAGFVQSTRAKAKIRQWFNSQNLEAAVAQGRGVLERELRRLGLASLNLEKLAEQFGCHKLDDFLHEIGRGEISASQIRSQLRNAAPAEEPQLIRRPQREGASGGILIVGVDKLLTTLARCCKPAPPDPIIGFVSRGRGVSIHRQSCSNLRSLDPNRLIAAQWGERAQSRFPVDIEVEAADRHGLLRDISDVFSRDRVNVIGVNTVSRKDQAKMRFTAEVNDLAQLDKVLELIREVPGIVRAARR